MDGTMIPLFKVFMSHGIRDKINDVLYSGYIGQGAVVDDFEKQLGDFLRNHFVVTVNSATSGLHLAIHMLKTEHEWADDAEVLATPMTCTATNWPILANRMKIKWVDIDPVTLNMDMDDLARKISPKTKLILLVHWGGRPVDLTRLLEVRRIFIEMFDTRLELIDDCAHALGSTWDDFPIGGGTSGTSVFSFQAIKTVTAIDGGAIAFPTNALYERAKRLRWYGIDREIRSDDLRCDINIREWGFKFHMNDVCATIGLENLKEIDKILIPDKLKAQYYDEQLKNIAGVRLIDSLPAKAHSSNWLYTMHVDDREDFIRVMKEKGIMTSKVHSRNDIHACVKDFRAYLPNMDKAEKTYVSIPVGWWVTKEDREHIVQSIKEGW
jgi:dTDP-4-amino-4,6-dideoxygalactose transaminase